MSKLRDIQIKSPTLKQHREMDYRLCKGFNHRMAPINLEVGQGEMILTSRCALCTTTRYDFLDMGMVLQKRRYKYPVGYREARKQSKSEWRVQYLRSLLNGSK